MEKEEISRLKSKISELEATISALRMTDPHSFATEREQEYSSVYLLKYVYGCMSRRLPFEIVGLYSNKWSAREAAFRLLKECQEDHMMKYLCKKDYDYYEADRCKFCKRWKKRNYLSMEKYVQETIEQKFEDTERAMLPVTLCIQEISVDDQNSALKIFEDSRAN